MTFVQLMNVAIISCLIFLSVFTLNKKSNTPIGYNFLSVFLFLLASNFADELLRPYYTAYPVLKIAVQPLLYAIAPFMYLSILHLTSIRISISLKTGLHFIPYLILVSIYLMAYFNHDVNKSNLAKSESGISLSDFILYLFFVQVFVYLYLCLKQLNQHKKNIVLFVSDIVPNDFHWINNTIWGIIIIAFSSLLDVLFFNHTSTPFYFYIIYLLLFYYIGFQITKQKDVFAFDETEKEGILAVNEPLSEALLNDNNQGTPSLKKQVLVDATSFTETLADRKKVIPEDKIAVLKIQLLKLMAEESPHLENDITLLKLGSALNLNTYQTSYLINTCFNENFYTFINRYRIDTFKSLLLDKQFSHLSLLGLAFESGFNSKTAFNTAFKKQTGLSPKVFKEKHLASLSEKRSSALSTL